MKQAVEVVRIKEIYKKDGFKIYCLFSNGEHRFIDFEALFKQWKIGPSEVEHPLLEAAELQKAELVNGTLSWGNLAVWLVGEDGEEKRYPYEIDPIVLYQNSQLDQDALVENLGALLKTERIKSGLTVKQLAKKIGISEEYITKLEDEKSNLELLLIRDILKKGFGKHLTINVE